jgi:two-component system osmolarity sensor histidine kinase EnvZ
MARLGLVWRLALIVVAALAVFQFLAFGAFLIQREQRGTLGFQPRLTAQVAALARLMDDSLPDERHVALQAVRVAGLDARVVAKPPPADGFRLQRAEQWLRQELGADRAVSIVVRAARPEGERWRPIRDLLARRVEISVQLASGEYLTVETAGELLNRIFGVPIGFLLSAVAALVTGLAIFGVVRETRPLRRLAVAVDRFGMEARPDPLPERGAPEVRSVIRATNAMQARISTLLRNQSLMIGAIAHDLRTYLTRLRLRLESIPDGERRDKAVRDVEDMHALIEDALAFARGAFAESRLEPVDLCALLAREVEERRLAGAEASLAQSAGPVTIQGSAADLARAFGNLIDNAIKYGDAAMVALHVDAGQVQVTVDDRGPGIPPWEREQVFEPFRQLDEARNRDRGGAGLGLAIARQVIERHRGTIVIEDAPEKGARFRVTLPR